MKGHEKDIEKTIKSPNIIRIAKIKPEKRLEFIRKADKTEFSAYNNVMVEYNDENKDRAHVLTSFYSEKIGSGGGSYVYINYKNSI